MHARDVPIQDVRRGRAEGRPREPGRSGSVQAPLVRGRGWILDRALSLGQRTMAQAPQPTERFLLGRMGLWARGRVFRAHQIGTRRQDGGLWFASTLSGSRSRPRPAYRSTQQAFATGARRVWLHTATDDHSNALLNYLSGGYAIVRERELKNPIRSPAAPGGEHTPE